ncbi:MAG: protein kinase, partial [archaeon]|nr:protein kinase [archaeon]
MLDEDRWIEYPDDQAFTGASEPLPPFGSSEYAMVMEAQLFRPLLPSPLSELLPENPGPSTNGADELLRQRYDEEREARVRLEREREHERGLFLAQQEQLRKLLESSSSSSSCSISISNNPDVISVASSEVTLLHEVGRGAFGQVFKARLRGKEVAVKQPLRQTAHPEVIAQFRAEMAVMVALHHPNLILLMGACFEPQRLFFVTEFAANGSLCDALFQRKVALPFPRKMAILKDVAQGMNWLHSLRPPLLHRDLKTGNVLLDDQWRAKVSDFGLSAIRSLDPDGNPLSAPDQQRVGSPFFMAPETLRTPPHTSPQSDLYSFAIVIWELLSEAPV